MRYGPYRRLACSLLFLAVTLNAASGGQTVVTPYYRLKFESMDRQISEYACGIAVLTTLFNHYFEINLSQQEVIDRYVAQIMEERRGISFLDLKKIAADRGFTAKGFKINLAALLEFLKVNTVPLIIHLNVRYGAEKVGHFCLLLGETDGYFIIQDPAYGNCVYTKSQLLDKWSGNILVIVPPENDKTTVERSRENMEKVIERGIERIQRMLYYESY
ncbi:MAG: hypothetical protein JW881_02835 [Spirochaetales bacterium]|nr:hypothetical protein [Spirochaetales bacterium]